MNLQQLVNYTLMCCYRYWLRGHLLLLISYDSLYLPACLSSFEAVVCPVICFLVDLTKVELDLQFGQPFC